MAIYTAQQAASAVLSYNTVQQKASLANLIAEYQQIFDTISTSAAAGMLSVDLKITKYDYNRIINVLLDSGYSVTELPVDTILQDDRLVTYTITVEWPEAVVAPKLTNVSPKQLTATVNLAFSGVITPVGGQPPYTFAVAGGSLPTGLSLGPLTRVNTLTVTGTVNSVGTGSIVLTITDNVKQTFTDVINWAVVQNTQLNVDWDASSGITQILNKPTLADVATTGSWTDLSNIPQTYYLGTSNLRFDRNSGQITLEGVNINGNAATVTNGVYTSSSYADPSWITSLSGTKLTGTVVATNGVVTTGSYTDPSWLTITKDKVGLSNVTNESKATMFTNSALTGTTTLAQGTLTTVTSSTTSLVNKAYVDRQVLFALAVGIWG